jgi:hypothetical protein
MKKVLVVLAVSGVATLLGLGAAGAVDYPATSGGLAVSSSSVAPGGRVTISGGGFAPGAQVQITVASTPTLLATVSADGSGSIQATVTIPSNLEPGTHTLSATGANPAGGTLVLTSTITVSGLALTGSNTGVLVGVALALLGAGVLLVVVTRRRRASNVS